MSTDIFFNLNANIDIFVLDFCHIYPTTPESVVFTELNCQVSFLIIHLDSVLNYLQRYFQKCILSQRGVSNNTEGHILNIKADTHGSTLQSLQSGVCWGLYLISFCGWLSMGMVLLGFRIVGGIHFHCHFIKILIYFWFLQGGGFYSLNICSVKHFSVSWTTYWQLQYCIEH